MIAEGGFKEIVINGHHRGRYLDDRFFWPVLARAEALKAPIYLHPTQSPKAVSDAWYGGLQPLVSEMMAGPGWGWHIETALHVLQDRFSAACSTPTPNCRSSSATWARRCRPC